LARDTVFGGKVKLPQWEKSLADFRNAVNGNAPHLMFQYFDFSKAPTAACWRLLGNGIAYRKLKKDTLEKFVSVIAQVSQGTENYYYQQVLASQNHFVQATALNTANFLASKIDELKKNAQDVKHHL
jgi:hypothetical protein